LDPVKKNVFGSSTSVYHIIPLYNEEGTIEEKVSNCIELKSEFRMVHVFVVDKSGDRTSEVINKFSKLFPDQIAVIDKGYRKGKNDSLNIAIDQLSPEENDILLFSDANTFFEKNAFKFLVESLREGYDLVGGSMQYYDEVTESAKSEGLYWKYEEWIRRSEAKLGRCIVVNGGNFAMLARHFRQLPEFVPNDLEAPLRLCGNGLSVGFNAQAKGLEAAVLNEEEETSRKRRMGNRQMNCVTYLWPELDLTTKMHIILRKVLRWSGFHFLLLNLVLTIIYGIFQMNYYFIFLGLLGLFFIVILALLHYFGNRNKLVMAFHHAMVVHVNSFNGMLSSVFGKKISFWDKAESNR
jgi:cellulose synthase/poly-beta-1,6-N-acetylglucosamine synthase-like glycosyltransferase